MFATGRVWVAAAVLGCAPPAGAAAAADAVRSAFGTLADGTRIDAVTLSNAHGVSARIIAFGATLQSLRTPDRDGRVADVTLGYDDLASYVARPNYWGATIGRYANRIAGGRFALDGRTYRLAANDGANALHGGAQGFDRRPWRIVAVRRGAAASVTLALHSPDGDQGFPGALDATVTYTLTEADELRIDMNATAAAPTIVNMTNHALFDLSGEGSAGGVLGHRLTVPASRYTPVDAALIPTGERRAVAGTPFDFTRARTIRDGRDAQIVAGRGYDHNLVLDKGATAAPALAARLEDPASGRVLEVLSTAPGLQVYSGNVLDGTIVGKAGHLYRMGDGIALEPQLFPDTPNRPAFGSARIAPGRPYHHGIVFRLTTTR